MKSLHLLAIRLLAVVMIAGNGFAQTTDDNFSFSEAVSLYSNYYYNPVFGYVDSGGTVRRGRQISEKPGQLGKFRLISGGTYDALTCSGFVVPVLTRFLYGRNQWQEQLKIHWADYQLGGAAIASRFGLRLSANLSYAQLTSAAAIQTLIGNGILNADSYYLFTTSHGSGGHVGFVRVNTDGTFTTFQYSDMNVRGLPSDQKKDPTDETYDTSKYTITSDGTLYRINGDQVLPIPVRPVGGMLPLILAQRTSMPGYYEGPFLDWYLGCPYGREQHDVGFYELTPPLKTRVIYTWSSQSRDLDIGVTFLGTSMGWSHSNNSPYMVWTGDDTSYAGSETVTIDLQKALDDGQIFVDTPVTIDLAAGWYSPAGGSGPANIKVQLLRQDAVLGERQRVISPGTQSTRCTYSVGQLIVNIEARTLELQ